MARLWNRWKRRRDVRWDSYRDSRDCWQNHRDDGDGLGWLRRTVVALLLFAVIYGAQMSGTAAGRYVCDGVRYVLTTDTDLSAAAEWLGGLLPENMDMAVLKRVGTTVSKPADPLLYMGKPAEGRLVSLYGWRTHPVLRQEMMHEGIDVAASLNASVVAAAPGKVRTVTENAQYGRTVVIEHGRGVDTLYGHLGDVLVKPGDTVSLGQVIARVGRSGMTDRPLLYFEVRENGRPVDPLTRIRGDFEGQGGR